MNHARIYIHTYYHMQHMHLIYVHPLTTKVIAFYFSNQNIYTYTPEYRTSLLAFPNFNIIKLKRMHYAMQLSLHTRVIITLGSRWQTSVRCLPLESQRRAGGCHAAFQSPRSHQPSMPAVQAYEYTERECRCNHRAQRWCVVQNVHNADTMHSMVRNVLASWMFKCQQAPMSTPCAWGASI